MDKVLAFSILSASPADIAPGASNGGSWARLSWRGRKLQEGDQARAEGKHGKQGGLPVEAEKQPGKGKSQSTRPRFAPEFDGIDCFETIVCH
ncbi:hypothetical protein CFC21_054975 [Triticum aestivum]|uniref:Uncharacterized protein n=1 Tax=Triticum aestivum TaxID=4565 RepID=A0A9R1GGJ3_WHEAT|nr:uncharacterized protein LOC123088164 [Triticum aestivum]KAF7045916.1 hypothetical protein CFC21_054975 [Triticum aestivum]